jgi:hypothetical protein
MGGPQAKTGVALPSSIRLGEHAVDRFIELVAAAPDGGQRVDTSDWTVRDVAVHVDIGVRAYVAYLQGERPRCSTRTTSPTATHAAFPRSRHSRLTP